VAHGHPRPSLSQPQSLHFLQLRPPRPPRREPVPGVRRSARSDIRRRRARTAPKGPTSPSPGQRPGIQDARPRRALKGRLNRACNYDRRGLPAVSPCPECGAVPEPSAGVNP
jgi:hypothetical protein